MPWRMPSAVPSSETAVAAVRRVAALLQTASTLGTHRVRHLRGAARSLPSAAAALQTRSDRGHVGCQSLTILCHQARLVTAPCKLTLV